MIETKDLILDKGKLEDWHCMYKNVWSRPESFRYMQIEPSPGEGEARERMGRTIAFQAKSPEAYTVYLKATGEAIGFANLNRPAGGTFEEGGICIGPDFWGRGYGRQILGALILRARELGGREFLYSSWEGNLASRALAEKAGFEPFAAEERVRERDGKRYVLLRYRRKL